MPVYLAPVSRRKFLARSVAGAAGLALGKPLLADSKATNPDFWALMADPHLAADRTLVERAVNMSQNFAKVSSELLGCPERPAGVFITGDCAFNSGETGDYANLTKTLEPIREAGTPIHLALGNHDNRERFWEVLHEEKAAKRPLDDKQMALLKTPRANWFILDSLEKTLSTPGLLGREQLDWLASSLDANPNKPALILIHHNPWISGNFGLKDSGALFEVIRPRPQVKAYIYGHTHAWRVHQDSSGIHLINLPPVSYVFHDGDPSGWVKMNLKPDGMRLELRCVDQAHNAHGQIVHLNWRV
jgi:Icc protein